MAKHTFKILWFSHGKIVRVCLAIFQHYVQCGIQNNHAGPKRTLQEINQISILMVPLKTKMKKTWDKLFKNRIKFVDDSL